MSTRSRRTPATAATASIVPPRASRRRKAVAATDDTPTAGEDEDEDSDSSSKVKQRSSKRQKRSPSPKKVTKRGGTRKKKQEEEEEDEEEAEEYESAEMDSPKPKPASQRSTRANAKNKPESDEEGDQEMKDENEKEEGDLNSLYGRHEHDAKLNELVEPKYELLFARETNSEVDSKPTAVRSGLPKILTQHICDFLSITDIASRLAATSRSGYVTAQSYAGLVQSQLVRAQTQDPEGNVLLPEASADDAQKQKFERDRVGVRRSEFPLLTLLSFYGSNRKSILQLKQFTYRILQSRLRGLITEVSSQYEIIQDPTRTDEEPLDRVLPSPSEISTALPHLHTADLTIHPKARTTDFTFPPGLRRLKLTLDLNLKWTPKTITQYLTRLFTSLKKLKYLNHLTIAPFNSYQDLPYLYRDMLIETLSALPHLRVLHSLYHKLLTSDIETIRRLPVTITDLSEFGRDDSNSGHQAKHKEFLAQVTKAPLPFLSLNTFAFDRIMHAEYIPIYTSLASTLTSLEFTYWCTCTTDVVWLGECTQLRTFSNCGESIPRYPRAPQPMNLSVAIPIPQLVEALTKCTHITDLGLSVEKMTTVEFDRLLSSMTSLRQLRISSSEVYSIESFAKHEHLTRNLKSLTMTLPRLLRDDVVHLYSLRSLESLNIAGSFCDPLYSNQLIILQGQTRRLPYIRQFTPRSQHEPVPKLPLAPEARSRILADFDTRVKSAVSSAELMHADELCVVFQFLNMNDFLRSACSCRSWNHAATLPYAWPPCSSTPFDTDANVNNSRRLTISTKSSQFLPSILPQLSLLRHVRYLRFTISLSDFGYRSWENQSTLHPDHSGRYQDMIGTLPLLTRLESLQLDMTDQLDNAPLEAALASLSPHLRHFSLNLESLPGSTLLQYSRPRLSFVGILTQLLTFHIQCTDLSSLPLMDFSQMHHLSAFGFGAIDELKKSGWLEQLCRLYLQKRRLRSIVCEKNGFKTKIDPTQWAKKVSA